MHELVCLPAVCIRPALMCLVNKSTYVLLMNSGRRSCSRPASSPSETCRLDWFVVKQAKHSAYLMAPCSCWSMQIYLPRYSRGSHLYSEAFPGKINRKKLQKSDGKKSFESADRILHSNYYFCSWGCGFHWIPDALQGYRSLRSPQIACSSTT